MRFWRTKTAKPVPTTALAARVRRPKFCGSGPSCVTRQQIRQPEYLQGCVTRRRGLPTGLRPVCLACHRSKFLLMKPSKAASECSGSLLM